MKLSNKLKKAKELEEEVKTIQRNANERARKKWLPLEDKAQKLKASVYGSSQGLVKSIEKDVNKFVKDMKKKYNKLEELNIESHVSYFGGKAEVVVHFEISLEDLINYQEGKRKKIKKKIVRDKKEKVITGGPRSIGHVMANMQKWEEREAEIKKKAKGKK